jgi:hypothetical protein
MVGLTRDHLILLYLTFIELYSIFQAITRAGKPVNIRSAGCGLSRGRPQWPRHISMARVWLLTNSLGGSGRLDDCINDRMVAAP